MTEVIGLLHEFLVHSLSIEAGLTDFSRACETLDEASQVQRAREFVNILDKVRRVGKCNIRSSHHTSRFLTMRIFANENANNI